MDQQRFMDILAHHDGSAVLETVVENFSNYDSDDETVEQSLFELVIKKFPEIGKPKGTYVPKPNVLLKPDPIKAVPPEAYRKRIDKIKRRQFFFKNLHRRDILYLQVINNERESYKCLVLAKHGDLVQLDDLSIIMYFPKLGPELKSIRGELYTFDLIRAAFWSCSAWEKKFFVTLDTQIFSEKELEKIPKLGRLNQIDLPHYVRSKKVGMTYAGYVQRSLGYVDENYSMDQIRECLGMDVTRIYSFFEGWNGKTYPASENFEAAMKNLTPDDSTIRLLKSFEYFREGNMYKALFYANKAIAFNPDNIQARVTRGTVYANLGKMRKAFIDTADSLKLNPKHESACKQMAELLVIASKTHLKRKNYFKWQEYLLMAKRYNPLNREAQDLLNSTRFYSANGILAPTHSSLGVALDIYSRLLNEEDKRRRVKQYKKIRKRKKRKLQRRRRRAARQKAKQQAMSGQPIPTTSTTRRQVYFRPSSPVFRRPFPVRTVSLRS